MRRDRVRHGLYALGARLEEMHAVAHAEAVDVEACVEIVECVDRDIQTAPETLCA